MVVAAEARPRRRIALVSFEFEGNDFSPKVSSRAEFGVFATGDAMLAAIEGCQLAVTAGAEVFQAEPGFELVPILVAQGGSGGRVDAAFYRATHAAIIEGFKACGPLDGAYLALHGAMVSPGVQDAEGDLLTELRALLGSNAMLAASLDLHAHVTARMVAAADILVGYENYPHDDAYHTGRRAATLLRDSLLGRLRPAMAMVRLDMLVPVTGDSTREPDAPLARVKALARGLERDGVVSTSYFPVQPWLDDDEAGCVALAIADGDAAQAQRAAQRIADAMWALRADFELPLHPVDQAIAAALQAAVKPAILADAADCVGAGATGDSAFVLEALLRRAAGHRCAVSLADAEVAALAHARGVGAVISATIGFRIDPRYGDPIPLEAEVVSLHDGRFVYSGGPGAGTEGNMGPCAVLKAGGVHILVTSHGTYEYADEQYRAVGMDLDACDIVVYKNVMNFRNVLRPDSTWMLVDSVGSSSPKLAALDWRHRSRPFWPRNRDIPSQVQ